MNTASDAMAKVQADTIEAVKASQDNMISEPRDVDARDALDALQPLAHDLLAAATPAAE